MQARIRPQRLLRGKQALQPLARLGRKPGRVSASLSGLSANATYHFRVVAKNAGGESKGADETLKTLPNCTAEGFCDSLQPHRKPRSTLRRTKRRGGRLKRQHLGRRLSPRPPAAVQLKPRIRQRARLRRHRQRPVQGDRRHRRKRQRRRLRLRPGNDRIQEFSSAGTFVRSFGSSAPGNGQLSSPTAVAIDSSGDVWVLNGSGAQEGGRIVEFSSSGTYMSQFGSKGTGSGQLLMASGMAFSGGHLYVSELDPQRVQEFSSSGEALASFDESGPGKPGDDPYAIASDPTTGDLYVSELCDRVQKFSPSGGLLASFGSGGRATGSCPTRRASRWPARAPSMSPTRATSACRNGKPANHRPSRPASATQKAAKCPSVNQTPWRWTQAPTSGSQTQPTTTCWSSTQAANSCARARLRRHRQRPVQGDRRHRRKRRGDVYASDPGNDRIQEFSSAGTFCAPSAPRRRATASCPPRPRWRSTQAVTSGS